ncbi:transcriptional regulator [Actinoplanes regularis]|nr:transcriptional regulator [Actinoplanes regularis]
MFCGTDPRLSGVGDARKIGPNAAGRMLRADLRRARDSIGLTQAQVAGHLKWSLSKMMRIERGDVGISTADLRALCEVLELGPAVADELVRRARSARERGWWHEFRGDIGPGYATLIGLEAEADRMIHFDCTVVSGLLQTAGYAEALQSSFLDEPDPQWVARRVALRLRRQQEVHARLDPPTLSVVLDESVLYRRIGSREIMAEQIRRLVEYARRPHLEIRVLPFESTEYRTDPFVLLGDGAGDMVYVESTIGDALFDDDATVQDFRKRFAALSAAALDAERTGQLLHRVADGYAAGADPRPWLWD